MYELELIDRIDARSRETRECAGTPRGAVRGPRARRGVVAIPGGVHVDLGDPDRRIAGERTHPREAAVDSGEPEAGPVATEQEPIGLYVLPTAVGVEANDGGPEPSDREHRGAVALAPRRDLEAHDR